GSQGESDVRRLGGRVVAIHELEVSQDQFVDGQVHHAGRLPTAGQPLGEGLVVLGPALEAAVAAEIDGLAVEGYDGLTGRLVQTVGWGTRWSCGHRRASNSGRLPAFVGLGAAPPGS